MYITIPAVVEEHIYHRMDQYQAHLTSEVERVKEILEARVALNQTINHKILTDNVSKIEAVKDDIDLRLAKLPNVCEDILQHQVQKNGFLWNLFVNETIIDQYYANPQYNNPFTQGAKANIAHLLNYKQLDNDLVVALKRVKLIEENEALLYSANFFESFFNVLQRIFKANPN